jgi:hypothetical protein
VWLPAIWWLPRPAHQTDNCQSKPVLLQFILKRKFILLCYQIHFPCPLAPQPPKNPNIIRLPNWIKKWQSMYIKNMENIHKTICDDETQLKQMNVRKSRFLQSDLSDGKQSILFRFAICIPITFYNSSGNPLIAKAKNELSHPTSDQRHQNHAAFLLQLCTKNCAWIIM